MREDRRLGALRRYNILDTEPEEAFDRITRLAADLFEVPIAIVNFVTGERQWFKSAVGTDEEETGLDVSFCAHTVENGRALVVEDLASDERFADNPYVAEEGLRFYAGVPLVTPDGHRLGTLCILDTEPRTLSEEAVARLSDLADVVMDELELRRESADRKQLAERLRQSQQLLQQSQRLAHVGGWEYDLRAETLTWTDETYRIHDLPVGSEIDVETAIDFYLPMARAVIRTRFWTLVEEGGSYDLELPIHTAGGERRWIRAIGEAQRDEETGDVVRVSGAVQDITDRRRANRELRKKNDLLQTLFDTIPVLIILFDEDGHLQLLNRECERALGWTQEDLVDHADPISLFYPDPQRQKEVRSFIEAGGGDWQDFQAQRKDGSTALLRGSVMSLADGRRIGIGIDVSEKKERERRLRLLEAAVEHTRLPILITEAAPLDEPGPRVEYANPAVKGVTGYDVQEIQGRSPRILQGPGTDREALDRIKAALETAEPVREVVLNYKKDGDPYWNDIYIAPVCDESGTVTHYVSVQDDVTERVRRREELKAAKEAAEEADRIKAALLTNMNHEFRTPLTSIISFSQLIRDSPELAEEFADRILGGGKRLLRTLNTIIDFAELEGDHLSATPERFCVDEVARSVVGDFQDRARRKSLDLEVEAPGGPVHAVQDKHLVERVLVHLVSNAVKFTEEGGAAVTVRNDGAAVEIEVADTGIGIPPEALPRVLEQFYQVSTGNDRTHEGNGLGLTVAKRIVDRMEGTIEVESEQGTGTWVTVRLPRNGSS